ncbi:hypothetical protein GBAR_LOCUS13841, partial [Geodia barretti]
SRGFCLQPVLRGDIRTIERTPLCTFDQIGDAGLAVVVKTRQDLRLLEMLCADRTG